MCHAIFELYACQSCCQASGTGLTRHGAAWLSLASAVPKGAKKSFKGLEGISLDVTEDSEGVQKGWDNSHDVICGVTGSECAEQQELLETQLLTKKTDVLRASLVNISDVYNH